MFPVEFALLAIDHHLPPSFDLCVDAMQNLSLAP